MCVCDCSEYCNPLPGSVGNTTTAASTTPTPKVKDFSFEAKFDGISLAIDDCEKKILSTVVRGQLPLMSVLVC